MTEAHLRRDPFVALVRLRYVLRSLSAIHYRPEYFSLLGDARVGAFTEHDGCGNIVAAAWDEAGVVVLGFDHDDPESEFQVEHGERTPERWLSSAPPELGAIVEVASNIDLRLATMGFWATAERSSRASTLKYPLGAYALPAAAAVASWAEDLSIEQAQVDLGVALAARALGGRTRLTQAEARIACQTPKVSRTPRRPEDVRAAAKLLAAVGVDWDPAPFLEENAPTPSRSKGEGPDARLLLAAFHGRLDDVKQALAEGANVDACVVAQQVPHTPAGATALVIALRRRHREMAEYLIASGAKVDVMTEGTWGGSEYALRVAAAQGDPGMVQRLLERGASVRPEEAFWGVLRHVLEGYARVRDVATGVGTDADYAQVIRLLLDRDAPLPNPYARDALANLADASGAHDLAERLSTKPTTAVVVPDVPTAPLVDPARIEAELPVMLEDALGRLAAGDRLRAVLAIEQAFRVARHPRIADLLDASPEPREFRLRSDAIEVLASMPATDDPRASRAALDALVTPADVTRPDAVVEASEDRAAAMLVASRDVRFTAALADRIARGRPGATRNVPRPSLVVALEALRAFTPPALSAANAERVSRLDDALCARRPAPGARPVRDMYMAVYEDPRNAALRDELAARLEAAGDPRGELIRLQRARGQTDKKASKRERELLGAHAKAWLGEIAPVIAEDEVFRDGFVWQATTGERGGSLTRTAGSYLIVSTGAGLQPEWATIERLSVWRHAGLTQGLLEGRWLHGLRELCDASLGELHAIAKGPPRPLEVLELWMPRNPDVWGEPYDTLCEEAFAKLPELREARISVGKLEMRRVERMVAGAKALRHLGVGSSHRKPLAFRSLLETALALKLASVTMLSSFDLRYDLQTRTAEIELVGGLHEQIAAAAARELGVLATAADAGLDRLVVRHPAKATITAVDGKGVGPVVSSKGRTADLTALWRVAKDAGAETALEAAVPHWARSPERNQ